MQSLLQCGEHPADKLEIVDADGKRRSLFFDISDYFGKL